jgi:hypothetical protein
MRWSPSGSAHIHRRVGVIDWPFDPWGGTFDVRSITGAGGASFSSSNGSTVVVVHETDIKTVRRKRLAKNVLTVPFR